MLIILAKYTELDDRYCYSYPLWRRDKYPIPFKQDTSVIPFLLINVCVYITVPQSLLNCDSLY